LLGKIVESSVTRDNADLRLGELLSKHFAQLTLHITKADCPIEGHRSLNADCADEMDCHASARIINSGHRKRPFGRSADCETQLGG